MSECEEECLCNLTCDECGGQILCNSAVFFTTDYLLRGYCVSLETKEILICAECFWSFGISNFNINLGKHLYISCNTCHENGGDLNDVVFSEKNENFIECIKCDGYICKEYCKGEGEKCFNNGKSCEMFCDEFYCNVCIKEDSSLLDKFKECKKCKETFCEYCFYDGEELICNNCINEKCIIIQNAFRKYRYNPSYKFCKIVLINNLENLGIEFEN